MARGWDELTARGQARRLRGLAAEALRAYPGRYAVGRCLGHGDTTSFVVTRRGGSGRRWVLCVHLDRSATLAEIRSELAWQRALARDTRLTVPAPVETRTGALLVEVGVAGVPGKPACRLVRWVAGRSRTGRRSPGSFEAMGRLMARLHAHAAAWRRPAGFRRPRWDWNGLMRGPWICGPDPDAIWRSFSTPRRRVFRRVADRLRVAMAAVGEGSGSVGLIHADLHFDNVVFVDGEARAFDFGDCGFGFWIYDMAVAMQFDSWTPGRDRLREALWRGYERVRPLPPGVREHLRTFQAGRQLDLALWVAAQARANPAVWATTAASYTPAAVQRCRAYLREAGVRV